jgi:hypothetical protein
LFAKENWNFKVYLRISDGGRSSMVEPQIVVLVVAGSSPVGHPPLQIQTSGSRLADVEITADSLGKNGHGTFFWSLKWHDRSIKVSSTLQTRMAAGCLPRRRIYGKSASHTGYR